MDAPVLALLAASVSFVVYLGYVLLAGMGTFWAVVWPDGQAVRRLRMMAVVGLALIGLGTIADAVIDWLAPGRVLGEVAAESGTWLLVRLAVLAGAGFFGAEVLVVGGGIPFFPQRERRVDLDLVETRTFGSRVVYLRYRVAR